MRNIFNFVFTVMWFAIGLSMAGTLKDCTGVMAKEAAIATKRGGISYGWWNRSLLNGKVQPRKPIEDRRN